MDGVDALDLISLAGLEAAQWLRTSQRPNRFVPVYPWFDVSLESELVSSGED